MFFVIAVCVALLMFVLFYAVDSIRTESSFVDAYVRDMYPGSFYISPSGVLPSSPMIKIVFGDVEKIIAVTPRAFSKLYRGAKVEAEVFKGRLSGLSHVASVKETA